MTEGRDCHAGWLAMTARSEASAERRGNLAKSLSDGREGLPRRLARNDGKIVVVARSEATAERRGNLAKSLSDGREGLPRRLARKDTGGEIATPAGSQGRKDYRRCEEQGISRATKQSC
ncbi:hypothetical protein AUK14_01645 [Candidatus Berkelbacteria bacterium CG2_30_39_44]|nr:MAG: hypothetical protein AUK14_01645 [Candidatus Berkelbacteria bacterium CG2_30_39_44]